MNLLALVPVHVQLKSKPESMSRIMILFYTYKIIYVPYFRKKREYQIKVNFDYADPDSFGVYSLNLWNGNNPISLTHNLVEDLRDQVEE